MKIESCHLYHIYLHHESINYCCLKIILKENKYLHAVHIRVSILHRSSLPARPRAEPYRPGRSKPRGRRPPRRTAACPANGTVGYERWTKNIFCRPKLYSSVLSVVNRFNQCYRFLPLCTHKLIYYSVHPVISAYFVMKISYYDSKNESNN